MKSLKLILTAVIMTLFVGMSYSQSASKIEARATEKVEELNAQILAGDETAALSEKQMEQVKGLYMKMFEGIKEIRKGEGTEEEKNERIRETRKTINREINQNVLTKAQRQAKQAGKSEE
ncbi:hypothetical protein [Lewinella sp. LCG006]|uniref:hypothetical protein n=1 Tax=Lewinella sp. LCG006 TaxID=3231911 RepID=UPI00345FB7EA